MVVDVAVAVAAAAEVEFVAVAVVCDEVLADDEADDEAADDEAAAADVEDEDVDEDATVAGTGDSGGGTFASVVPTTVVRLLIAAVAFIRSFSVAVPTPMKSTDVL